ncbi:MAG: carbamoyltransferase HypF [Plesiomonas shigelloides]
MTGIRIRVRGKVQGVGFRPYVWQIAHELGLTGDVRNDAEGVLIHLAEVTEDCAVFRQFTDLLYARCPPLAQIQALEVAAWQPSSVPQTFTITATAGGQMATQIVPDAATCPACLGEMRDPADRRFGYPFINCTHCGPRFTIIRSMPYDRPFTAMAAFPMCPACQREYDDPADRRFHAQPNACPQCGPQICWVDASFLDESLCLPRIDDLFAQGHTDSQQVIAQAVQALLRGEIVAVRGLGGFHLACDATNAEAVARLRMRKHRPGKPLAVMLPSLDWLDVCADFSAEQPRFALLELESELAALRCREHAVSALTSAAAPIVLVPKRASADELCAERFSDAEPTPLADNIAPHLGEVGVMLPSSPLQHLLLDAVGRPLVMTSGNASGKPPALSNAEALQDLRHIADGWLLHNRDIVQRADDSLLRATPEGTEMLRRARGYVPDPLLLPDGFAPLPAILATGADLKNTFCLIPANMAESIAINQGDNKTSPEPLTLTHVNLAHVNTELRNSAASETKSKIDYNIGNHIAGDMASDIDSNIENKLPPKSMAVLSPHFGDLSDPDLAQQVNRSTAFFCEIYNVAPQIIATDSHSGYFSRRNAENLYSAKKIIPVMHHHAHIAAVMAEYGLALNHSPILGLALDGIGMGENNALWGGECLLADYTTFVHLGGIPATPLPGGDKAAREPWRNLLAQCHAAVQDWQNTELGKILQPYATGLLCHAIEREINCPPASSCGRLFDAVAAALGICTDAVSFEGEAACRLESLAWQALVQEHEQGDFLSSALEHDFPLQMPLLFSEARSARNQLNVVGTEQLILSHKFNDDKNSEKIVDIRPVNYFQQAKDLPKSSLDLAAFWHSWLNYRATDSDKAFAFHVALANGLAEMVNYYASRLGIAKVVLSGGVLHNRLLRVLLLKKLNHLEVLTPQIIPAGDGGLSLGQAVIAAARILNPL